MTVYVITEGEYSDYHIIAVSLDKEKAKIIADAFSNTYDKANVEEYETDTFELIKEGNKIYEVIYDANEYRVRETMWLDNDEKLNTVQKFKDVYQVKILTKDVDHAFKIGVDLINEYKAREQGIAV